MSVSDIYHQELSNRGYAADPAQLRAVQALDQCASEWTHYKHKRGNSLKKLINHPDIPKGVYLYGGVGRGKSFRRLVLTWILCLRRCRVMRVSW